MNRRQSRVAICFALATLAFSSNGFGQSKPAKKIRVGVPSVGMGNIITFVVKEGKLFHRSFAQTPKSGAIVLCIKAPRPGRYALFLTHDRDGANKCNFWKDGAGVPSNRKLGRSKPKLSDGIVTVGANATSITMVATGQKMLAGSSGGAPRPSATQPSQ